MTGETGDRAREPAILDIDDAASWDCAIEALDPARLLATIDRWLDGPLRAHVAAEDIWQECLLVAWRRRAAFRWQGLASFRAWLLEIAQHCAADARDRAGAQKRGGGRPALALALDGDAGSSPPTPAFSSTTPGRLAELREHAQIMRQALTELDDDVRDVVRMRVFEELSCEEVARQLGLGLSAVKHRARRGTIDYERRVRTLLARRGGSSQLSR